MTLTWTSDMTPSQGFWDKVSRKYAASPVKDQAAYEKTLARVVEHLGPEDQVLELGSGTGSTALLLAGNVKRYLSTDFSPGMIEIAQEKLEAGLAAGDAPGNLSFLAADADDQRLPQFAGPDGFDAVLAFNFLHLVKQPEDVLSRIHKLLKPGGLYISKTVCLKRRAWLFGPVIRALRLIGKAPHVTMLSPDDVNDLHRAAGFEILETGLYPAPYSHFVVARKI